MPSHNRKGRSKQAGPQFVQLFRCVKRSKVYHELGPYARNALIELLDRYTGANNGMIVMSVRMLADELNCSKDTASKALRDLDDAGLIRPMRNGNWRGRQATEWRIIFYRCNVTGEPAYRKFKPRTHRPESPVERPQSPAGRTVDNSKSGRKDTNAKKLNKRVIPKSGERDTYTSTIGGIAIGTPS